MGRNHVFPVLFAHNFGSPQLFHVLSALYAVPHAHGRLQAQTQRQPHINPLIPSIVSLHSAGRCLGRLRTSLVGVDFLAVLVVSNAGWRSTVAATFARADTNDLSVDGAGDAVLQLQVHLWDAVFGENGGIGDITDSGRLDHVTDRESLDRLVLWRTSRAVAAPNGLDVSTSGLVTSAVTGSSAFVP